MQKGHLLLKDNTFVATLNTNSTINQYRARCIVCCMCVCVCLFVSELGVQSGVCSSFTPITQQCGHRLPPMRIFLLPITVLIVIDTCILKKVHYLYWILVSSEYPAQLLFAHSCDFHLALNVCARQHESKCQKWRIENSTHTYFHRSTFLFKMSKTWAPCLPSFHIVSLALCGFPAKHHGILKS